MIWVIDSIRLNYFLFDYTIKNIKINLSLTQHGIKNFNKNITLNNRISKRKKPKDIYISKNPYPDSFINV